MADKVETKPLSGGKFGIYTMPEGERSSLSHEYPAIVSEIEKDGEVHLQVFAPFAVQTRRDVKVDTSGAPGTFRYT